MIKTTLIGRKKEQEVLKKALHSSEAEMISVIGRRRVGKTFLVERVYEQELVFSMTGIKNATRKEQLRNFTIRLKRYAPKALIAAPPKDWLDAFVLLIDYLEQLDRGEKAVVFFDELPWLASHKSGFLKGLSFFWNSWAVRQRIVLVVCGSAAAWMIRKLINNKGGLYNRLTRRLILKPFDLSETEAYLKSRGVQLNRYHIVQLYMAMGGIPHYLKEIESGRSAAQNIDAICFDNTGLLKDEFSKLYLALFDDAARHIAVIRALATKRQGMTREEIISTANIPNGGSLTRVLEELIQSDFIAAYKPFNKKKKSKLYRLTDEYSLFYLQFMENKELEETNTWKGLSQTQSYKIWSGYAFENICLKHVPQIKKTLGIAGVYSSTSSFYKKGTAYQKGVQIDLLIDRNDHVINLVEIKFYNTLFMVSKEFSNSLREKTATFQAVTKTSKQVFVSLITTFGILPNEYSSDLLDNVLTLDDLFEM